jgi:hypothetical protein
MRKPIPWPAQTLAEVDAMARQRARAEQRAISRAEQLEELFLRGLLVSSNEPERLARQTAPLRARLVDPRDAFVVAVVHVGLEWSKELN